MPFIDVELIRKWANEAPAGNTKAISHLGNLSKFEIYDLEIIKAKVLPSLLTCLQHPSLKIKRHAAWAISVFFDLAGPEICALANDSNVMSRLIWALNEPDLLIQRDIALSLRHLSSTVRLFSLLQALPLILHKIPTADQAVQLHLLTCIAHLSEQSSFIHEMKIHLPLLPTLVTYLQHSEPTFRRQAVVALDNFVNDAEGVQAVMKTAGALQAFINYLRAPDPGMIFILSCAHLHKLEATVEKIPTFSTSHLMPRREADILNDLFTRNLAKEGMKRRRLFNPLAIPSEILSGLTHTDPHVQMSSYWLLSAFIEAKAQQTFFILPDDLLDNLIQGLVSAHPSIPRDAIRTLNTLTNSCPKELLTHRTFIQAILQCFSAEDMYLQQHAVACIHSLSEKIVCQYPALLPLIIPALSACIKSEEVEIQKMAGLTFENFSAHADGLEQILTTGAFPAFIHYLVNPTHTFHIPHVEALKRFSEIPMGLSAIVQEGQIKPLVVALSNPSPTIQTSALDILAKLAQHEPFLPDLLKNGLISGLLQTITMNQDAALLNTALNLLNHLRKHELITFLSFDAYTNPRLFQYQLLLPDSEIASSDTLFSAATNIDPQLFDAILASSHFVSVMRVRQHKTLEEVIQESELPEDEKTRRLTAIQKADEGEEKRLNEEKLEFQRDTLHLFALDYFPDRVLNKDNPLLEITHWLKEKLGADFSDFEHLLFQDANYELLEILTRLEAFYDVITKAIQKGLAPIRLLFDEGTTYDFSDDKTMLKEQCLHFEKLKLRCDEAYVCRTLFGDELSSKNHKLKKPHLIQQLMATKLWRILEAHYHQMVEEIDVNGTAQLKWRQCVEKTLSKDNPLSLTPFESLLIQQLILSEDEEALLPDIKQVHPALLFWRHPKTNSTLFKRYFQIDWGTIAWAIDAISKESPYRNMMEKELEYCYSIDFNMDERILKRYELGLWDLYWPSLLKTQSYQINFDTLTPEQYRSLASKDAAFCFGCLLERKDFEEHVMLLAEKLHQQLSDMRLILMTLSQREGTDQARQGIFMAIQQYRQALENFKNLLPKYEHLFKENHATSSFFKKPRTLCDGASKDETYYYSYL